MDLVRNSELYLQAKKLRGDNKKERQDLFNQAREQHRFNDYALKTFATQVANRSKWIASKLGAHEKQTIGTRAFKAVDKILFGQAKKIRFKVTTRFKSVEGQSNATGIRFMTHLDGSRIKKSLSERVHRDATGIKPMHRDLFSAYLARCVYGDVLSLRDAQWEYPDTEPYLLEAWHC